MNDSSIQQAIIDDPEEDAPRLTYADWLADNGQGDRAEWIRASVEVAKITTRDSSYDAAWNRRRDAWVRCKPAYWEELKNIDQKNDRGVFRFILGSSRTARSSASIKRLSKATWLVQAMEQGWLQRIEVWVDGEFTKLISFIKEPVSKIPLLITAAPQLGDDDLRQIMTLPQLQGLDLPAHVLRNNAAKQIASCETLRDLTIEIAPLENSIVDAFLDQIVSMPKLRKLRIIGHARRPNDTDVLRLTAMAGLKRLKLSASPAVTTSGIAELHRLKPSLIVNR